MKTKLVPENGGDPVAEAPEDARGLTLDDRLAAVAPREPATAAEIDAAFHPAPADDGRIPVTVRLTPRHFDYLCQRAAQHGEMPARHLETILRNFRAYHDDRRPELQPGVPVPGGGPVIRRMG